MGLAWIAAVVALAANAPHIHDLQGAAHVAPFVDREVIDVEGVVTQLSQLGFYMQDPAPDDDDSTSEAIRVSWQGRVAVGDLVRVAGTVREVRPGCSACSAASEAFANLSITEMAASDVAVVGSAELPEAVRLGSGTGARLPPSEIIDDDTAGDVESGATTFDPARDGIDFYESLEGMRVRIDGARAVGPTVRSARGNGVPVVAGGETGYGPVGSRGGLVETPDDGNPERIIVTNAPGVGLPDLGVGDQWMGSIVGVVDYAFGHFDVVASEVPLAWRLAPPREPHSWAPPGRDELTAATFNVENLGPNAAPGKLDAIADLVALDLAAPDLLVLQEIQDDSGPIDDGTTGAGRTYGALIDAIAAHGGPVYDFCDVPPDDAADGGEPGSNIRVGFLFRRDRGLALVERRGRTETGARIAIDSGGFPASTESPGRIDPTNEAFDRSRKPVVVELRFRDRPLFAVGVHFKSQIGDQPLFGRFQPPARPTRVQRTEQARSVARFVRQLMDADPRALVLVAGDFNDGPGSPPLAALEASGLSDLVEDLPLAERYSHNFEGNSEALDHLLASPALAARLVGLRIVHANADFVGAASDHDPVVARFALPPERERAAAGCSCRLARTLETRDGSRAPPCLALAAWVASAVRRARRGRHGDRKPTAKPGKRPVVPFVAVPRTSRRLLSGRCFSGKDVRP